MERTGLTIGIVRAVSDIADGRIGLRTKGKTEEGREDFAKGLALGKQLFTEVKDCRDPELMLLAEYLFMNQELEGARSEEKIGRASYQSAVHDFDDAFLSLKSVKDAAMYQGAENTHPHRAPFRYKGMPNDAFHIAYTGHYARLQNKLKPIGIDPDEQILTELRMAVCKSAQGVYLETQRSVLGEGTAVLRA
ncbi:hypothetical protein AGMMS49942_15160 [Spirochaetia bacterium]|nr:hypothetical protein AGMMS49942_15160 [Spirochaetia bacterium]